MRLIKNGQVLIDNCVEKKDILIERKRLNTREESEDNFHENSLYSTGIL